MYTEVIRPQKSLFDLKLKSVWQYRDLLFMFVRRDFVAAYKQTILGPLWFFIQPIFTTIMFTFVFGNIAQISTDGQPKILFYLSGITIWNYFSECFTKTSNLFVTNAGIYGKVYFPRLITPLSIIVSGLMRFSLQFLLFLSIWIYFLFNNTYSIEPNQALLILPFLVLLMAGFAMGMGMIISSFTTKYRDLVHLISFGVTLLMYSTPVIYPLSNLPDKYRFIILANPLSSIIETFRYAFLGSGVFSWAHLSYSFFFMIIILLFGIVIFNKVERNFMDTV